MRQTRRSRSTAATPQKDEPANQAEEVQATEKSAKANLETVFEKESNVQEEVGAAAADTGAVTPVAEGSSSSEEQPKVATEGDTVAPEETEAKAEVSEEKPPEASPKAASPKKADCLIELNCQVCNCSFTNYHEHMNSEAHKSKIMPLTNVKNDNQPKIMPLMNIKNDSQVNADKSPQKRSSDQDGAPAAKRQKNQVQNPQNASGQKFYCDVCNLTLFKQQDYEFHMNGKKHLLNVNKAQGKSYCEICKLFFNTLTDLNDHTESQLHKKNLAEKKQDKQVLECTLCKVVSHGLAQHEQHLTSKRHKRSLERPDGGNPTSSSKAVVTASAVNGNAQPNLDKTGNKKWIYVCNACDYGCNQDQQFSSHVNLADHKAAVTDMRKKGLVLEKDNAKPTASKITASGPAARKFPLNNTTAANRINAPQGAANKANVFRANNQGPVTKVTYNIVSGPNVNSNAPAAGKPVQVKKDVGPANRKGPMSGPGGPVGPNGPKKNVPLGNMKPNMGAMKAPLPGRPNPRFSAQQNEVSANKFISNPPMKMGFQKRPYDGSGNFGPAFGVPAEPNNSGNSFSNYGGRPAGNFGGNMRSDNMGPGVDVRNDYRGNARDNYPDIRDIRNVDLGVDNRADGNFRSGFYREMPGDVGRDARGDYGGNFRRNDLNVESRPDMRSGMGSDMRGMARSDLSRDIGGETRNYSMNDVRDLRNDTRSDYLRDRASAAGYGGSAGFSQQSYRGSDDFRYDAQGRSGQVSGQVTPAGNFTSGMMGSSRYDSFVNRSATVYPNQYGGSSRGIGYMGDMPLNGR